jgi:hydroxymethylpyrimidine/phosphomethylpyrimidine kinase
MNAQNPGKPIVLTVAGFDPSACAGILADIKTFEAHQVYGMAVATANTFQNVIEFQRPNWNKPEDLFTQLHLLQKSQSFDYVKIGLIENFSILNDLLEELTAHNKNCKVIWDPICSASAPFEFHKQIDKNQLENICAKIYLITPNMEEIAVLVPDTEPDIAGKYLSQFCNVLIKGGHSKDSTANDTLYQGESTYLFKADKLGNFSKRGTGCVLSSSILANLALGKDLIHACESAKAYINTYLTSNHSPIGFHSYANQ